MEPFQEQEREPLEPIRWTCENCDGAYDMDDDNAALFVFPTDTKYTFVQLHCEDEECANVTSYFADIEDLEQIARRLTNIYPMYEVPEWVRDGYEDVQKKIGAVILEAVVVSDVSLQDQWDNFIEYVEPWEIIEHGKFRVK